MLEIEWIDHISLWVTTDNKLDLTMVYLNPITKYLTNPDKYNKTFQMQLVLEPNKITVSYRVY
jgi:hypothetical protein